MSVCQAVRMWTTAEVAGIDEHLMRKQILAFLDEYCRGMTLADVREWYADAVGPDALSCSEARRS